MKTELSEYEVQANTFLIRNAIKFRCTLSDSKPCPWQPTGQKSPHHYRVTLSGSSQLEENNGKRRITFDFWGSITDAEKGEHPTAYDVLACISSDVNAGDEFTGFGEWCDNYGYERDSIKALQTYRRCSAFAKRLRAFFTAAELEQLSEIN